MISKKTTILFLLTMGLLVVLPLISAYGWNSWSYYSSPLDFLENPWIMFALIFIILFGVIFYVLSKSFKNNAVAMSIALALSIFISMAIAQRGLLYDYGGGELSSWALVIASLIGIAFLVRFANESFGRIGVAITVGLFWIIMYNLDPYQVLPNSLLSSGFYRFYEWLFIGDSAIVVAIVLIILAVIFGAKGPRPVGRGARDAYRYAKGLWDDRHN